MFVCRSHRASLGKYWAGISLVERRVSIPDIRENFKGQKVTAQSPRRIEWKFIAQLYPLDQVSYVLIRFSVAGF